MSTARYSMPASHPCLAGHFPGRPLVPGVVLLDAVFEAVAAAGHGAVTKLRHAKFVAPVGPEQPVEITLTQPAPGRIAFRCLSEGALALSGEVELGPP
jgi:3-hydroxymyristoyl/3-hydroxydecanoyl-(acyl carrier protein) dehydratase